MREEEVERLDDLVAHDAETDHVGEPDGDLTRLEAHVRRTAGDATGTITIRNNAPTMKKIGRFWISVSVSCGIPSRIGSSMRIRCQR